jgi:hypothetical protein
MLGDVIDDVSRAVTICVGCKRLDADKSPGTAVNTFEYLMRGYGYLRCGACRRWLVTYRGYH